jgi:hypothetical protein
MHCERIALPPELQAPVQAKQSTSNRTPCNGEVCRQTPDPQFNFRCNFAISKRMQRFAPHLLVITAALVVSALLPVTGAPEPEVTARQAGVRVLGAARGYAATALWLRSSDAYRQGDLFETLATYQLIAELQPRNPAVYAFMAWNQGYNISAQFPDRPQREDWVRRGYATLHEAQGRMPVDASLRMDEWHYVLNRSAEYPLVLLRNALARYGNDAPRWRAIAEGLLESHSRLDDRQAAALEHFLREYGLSVQLFELTEHFLSLPVPEQTRLLAAIEDDSADAEDFPPGLHPFDVELVRGFLALEDHLQAVLAVAHWCRLHLLVMVLERAVEMWPRPPVLERALLNSYVLAWQYALPGQEQEFLSGYREGVAVAWQAGIENARHRRGDAEVQRFVEDMTLNLQEAPELKSGVMDDAG